MKQTAVSGIAFVLILALAGGGMISGNDLAASKATMESTGYEEQTEQPQKASLEAMYTINTPITEVIHDASFGDCGRLIFPVNSSYYSGDTLGQLRLTWYNNIDPDKTVEIVNYMKTQADAGNTIFYDIYTDEEKAADPAKEDTGLFFFKGLPGEKFALCNAGGAQTACEDLARAITFIFDHREELEVSTEDYSLWGGSAGARMAAWVGSYGTAAFGGDALPQPAAVIMQYTGLSEYSEADPATFVAVGKNDWIADWRTMKQRLDGMSALGIDTEFHAYPGLGHGFGLGSGTEAEGWIDAAIAFWERQAQ